MSIIHHLNQAKDQVFNGKAYTGQDIPDKKIDGAIKSYAQNVTPEEILLLVDTTVFGSGKDGFLFTNTTCHYKEAFGDSFLIDYHQISEASYKEEKKEKGKKTEVIKTVEVNLENGETLTFKGITSCCEIQKLAVLFNSLKASASEGQTEAVRMLPLEEMDFEIKELYLKLIINYALSDDGIVDPQEFAAIYSLIVRLNLTGEERQKLSLYLASSDEQQDTTTLFNELKNKIDDINLQCVTVSLFKDVLYLKKIKKDESEGGTAFIENLKHLSNINGEQINLIEQALDNDQKIFDAKSTDKTIQGNVKELVAAASAVGVPMTALYLSGSVVGLGATGITSGLATLGFGGVLGFSSMATGLGVALLLGYGAHKGMKVLTGSNELERAKRKEAMLQAVVRQTQKTINVLIEDVNIFSTELIKLIQEGKSNAVRIAKLSKLVTLLNAGGKSLVSTSTNAENLALRTKAPETLDLEKLKALTQDATKKKYYDIVFSCYQLEKDTESEEPKENYVLRQDLPLETIEELVNIFSLIEYFSVAGLAKNASEKFKNLF